MSVTVQCLLRLPTCLRRKAFLDILPRKQIPLREHFFGMSISQRCATRAFSNTPRTLKRKTPPPALSKSHNAPNRPPAARPPPPERFTASNPVASILGSQRIVLIYRAPSHTSFRILCIGFGTVFIVGAFFGTELVMNPTNAIGQPVVPTKWWIQSISMVPPFFLAIMGTAFLLAPSKSIKSITAIAPILGPREVLSKDRVVLRCELRRWLPYTAPKYIEAPAHEVFLDKNVAAHKVEYWSVPMERSSDFTASHEGKPAASKTSSASADDAALSYKGKPKVTVNPIAAFTRDIRRMFYRDGFAYLRFKDHGNWKVDLQSSELLDHGRALERLTTSDDQAGAGIIAWIRRRYVK